jgi:hypothetical protein
MRNVWQVSETSGWPIQSWANVESWWVWPVSSGQFGTSSRPLKSVENFNWVNWLLATSQIRSKNPLFGWLIFLRVQQPIGRLIRNSIPNRPFYCSWKEHIVHTSKVHGTLIVYQKRSFFGSNKSVPHIWSPLKLRRKSAIWLEAGKSFEAETSTKGASCSLDKRGCGS